MTTGLSRTSLNVAAHRAQETERRGALFADPFARRLAGPEGFAAAEEIARLSGLSWPTDAPSMFALRTRYFDDAVLDAVSEDGVRQVVALGSGMDTRAYRLHWPDGTQLFEVDRPEAFDHKEPILVEMGARPRCGRRAVRADLRDDWIGALVAAGLLQDAPTVWIVEGLIYYLPDPEVHRLLDALAALSPSGSTLIVDVAHPMMRDLAELQAWRDALAAMGEPFRSFTDDGCALLAAHGWDATACSIVDVARQVGIALEAGGSLAVPRLLCARRR